MQDLAYTMIKLDGLVYRSTTELKKWAIIIPVNFPRSELEDVLIVS